MATAPKQQKVLAVVETTPEKMNAAFNQVEPKDTVEAFSTTMVQKNAPSPGTQVLVTAVGPSPAPQETSVAAQHEKMQVDETKESTPDEAKNGMQVEDSTPKNEVLEVPGGSLPLQKYLLRS